MKTCAILCFTALFITVQAESSAATESTSPEEITASSVGDSQSTKTTDAPQQGQTQSRTQIKEQLATLTHKCKVSSKASQDQAKIAVSQTIPKTEAEKCFLACIYEGLGITKGGQFSVSGSKSLVQLHFASNQDELNKANTMIEACAKEAIVKDANESCALGRLVRECFVKNGVKISFFLKA